jgi:hypothetical protein
MRLGDARVVEFARAWREPTCVVGHLDLADPGQALAAPLGQVALADLRVTKVKIDP